MADAPHVLVVGGSMHVPPFLGHLRANPVTTSVICAADLVPRIGDAAEHAHVIGVGADAGLDHWAALALAVHAQRRVDRIACFDDSYVRHAARIGETLGVAWHSEKSVLLAHHKGELRERLRQTGVEDVASAAVGAAADVVAFAEAHGWPVVVKPGRGVGSIGVSVVESEAAVAAALARIDAPSELIGEGVLVEEFLAGPQFSVEAVSEHGDHEIVVITKKFSDPRHMVEIGHVLPAPIPPDAARAIRDHVSATLDAIGVRTGLTSTELVLTDRGPRVLETHLRPSGGELPVLIREALGVDLLGLAARQALGEEILPGLRDRQAPSRYAAIWHAFPDADGTVHAVHGEAAAAAMPGVVEAACLAEPGDEVTRLTSNQAREAFVITAHTDPEEALAAARAAAAQLSFVIELRGTTPEPV